MVDWQISSNCRVFFTVNVLCSVGRNVAFVSQKPKSPKSYASLYGEFFKHVEILRLSSYLLKI